MINKFLNECLNNFESINTQLIEIPYMIYAQFGSLFYNEQAYSGAKPDTPWKELLQKVVENWLEYFRASRGDHLPEIIFKI